MTEIPLKPLYRFAKKNGAERISHDAVRDLGDIIEEMIIEIISEANAVCVREGKKTIKSRHIEQAKASLSGQSYEEKTETKEEKKAKELEQREKEVLKEVSTGTGSKEKETVQK